MLTANADRVVNSVSSSILYAKFWNSDSGFLHHVQPTFILGRHTDQRLTELRRFSEGKSVFSAIYSLFSGGSGTEESQSL